ncbi:hypothetical protein AVEN_89764-1 [Araneus ventricosus]|nr:hypothetical protein AVEN_89764-1 [Araneus ventricosus]
MRGETFTCPDLIVNPSPLLAPELQIRNICRCDSISGSIRHRLLFAITLTSPFGGRQGGVSAPFPPIPRNLGAPRRPTIAFPAPDTSFSPRNVRHVRLVSGSLRFRPSIGGRHLGLFILRVASWKRLEGKKGADRETEREIKVASTHTHTDDPQPSWSHRNGDQLLRIHFFQKRRKLANIYLGRYYCHQVVRHSRDIVYLFLGIGHSEQPEIPIKAFCSAVSGVL